MAWIHLVDYYINGLAENVKAFSVPVLFEGHDNRASNRLALDYTLPLPELQGEVKVFLLAQVYHRRKGEFLYQTDLAKVSTIVGADIILQPPNQWTSTQVSIAYQLVDAFGLNLKSNYVDHELILFPVGDITQLAPNMKRLFIR